MSVTILEAMADPALFGGDFGGATWDPWRALLAGFYGLPTNAVAFRGLTGRLPPAVPASELWTIAGRRGGKSRIAALIATFEGCFTDHRAELAAGETATVLLIASDRRQARTCFRYVRGLIHGNDMLRGMILRERMGEIELSNRTVIEVGTATLGGLRGYTVAAAVLDELAFWSTDGSNPAAEVISSLRPALATLRGKIVAISSPYSRRGPLWDTYRRYYGQEDRRILVAQAPSVVLNPALDPGIVADALEADAASASAEWLAQFRTDLEEFVKREVIEACIEPSVVERLPIRGVEYRAFCDPSGGVSDSMTLAIGHAEGDSFILDCLREAKAPFDPSAIVASFTETLRAYRCGRVSGDRYGGSWPEEQFRKLGVKYEAAGKAKSDIYRDFLPLLTSGKAELLDQPRLINQLVSLERRTARGGRDSIDHAPNAHDDCANAVAGVLAGLAAKAEPRQTMATYTIVGLQ